METFEYVVNIEVANGASVGQVDFVPDPGQIIGCKIFYPAYNNPGIVNASILGTNKEELSKPQHIDNYRDRNSKYLDCKPLDTPGAKKMYFRIEATEAFTADFIGQLILIYDKAKLLIDENC